MRAAQCILAPRTGQGSIPSTWGESQSPSSDLHYLKPLCLATNLRIGKPPPTSLSQSQILTAWGHLPTTYCSRIYGILPQVRGGQRKPCGFKSRRVRWENTGLVGSVDCVILAISQVALDPISRWRKVRHLTLALVDIVPFSSTTSTHNLSLFSATLSFTTSLTSSTVSNPFLIKRCHSARNRVLDYDTPIGASIVHFGT
jgi:hypothetical protein